MVLDTIVDVCLGNSRFVDVVISILKTCDFASDVFFILGVYTVMKEQSGFIGIFICAILFTLIGGIIDILKLLIALCGRGDKWKKMADKQTYILFAVFVEDIPQIIINGVYIFKCLDKVRCYADTTGSAKAATSNETLATIDTIATSLGVSTQLSKMDFSDKTFAYISIGFSTLFLIINMRSSCATIKYANHMEGREIARRCGVDID